MCLFSISFLLSFISNLSACFSCVPCERNPELLCHTNALGWLSSYKERVQSVLKSVVFTLDKCTYTLLPTCLHVSTLLPSLMCLGLSLVPAYLCSSFSSFLDNTWIPPTTPELHTWHMYPSAILLPTHIHISLLTTASHAFGASTDAHLPFLLALLVSVQ